MPVSIQNQNLVSELLVSVIQYQYRNRLYFGPRCLGEREKQGIKFLSIKGFEGVNIHWIYEGYGTG